MSRPAISTKGGAQADALANGLHEAEAALTACGDAFRQLAALFRSIKNGEAEADQLLSLGGFVAEDWANTADYSGGEAATVRAQWHSNQRNSEIKAA